MFTIHNIAYQGNFWHWDMELTGIDWKYFNWRQMEFYGNLSFLKSGLAFADALSTVSPRYAQEIQSLAARLRAGRHPAAPPRRSVRHHQRRRLHVSGIRRSIRISNGHNYGVKNFAEGKRACKAALQQEMGLPSVAGSAAGGDVGRLADQKGFDLVARLIRQWAETSPIQWVILGTGEPQYHELLAGLASGIPTEWPFGSAFSNELAHRIEAAADIFLMPSRYEPCGLNQLYSLKYGTVPVVHATGGLADTITNLTDETLAAGTANGFSFDQYTPAALAEALDRACRAYANRPVWEQLIRTGMLQDWSWTHSAREYGRLYERTLAKRHEASLQGSA